MQAELSLLILVKCVNLPQKDFFHFCFFQFCIWPILFVRLHNNQPLVCQYIYHHLFQPIASQLSCYGRFVFAPSASQSHFFSTSAPHPPTEWCSFARESARCREEPLGFCIRPRGEGKLRQSDTTLWEVKGGWNRRRAPAGVWWDTPPHLPHTPN